MWRYLIVLALAGCATEPERGAIPSQTWQKPTGDEAMLKMDAGACRMQAVSTSGRSVEQIRQIYEACLESKGWSLVRTHQ